MKRAGFRLAALTVARASSAQTAYEVLLEGGLVIDGRNGGPVAATAG